MNKRRGQVVTDKILDTAERLFYIQGYHNTGINQVIGEADVAKASLYKHFESKEDLMLAYLQRLHQHWFERLQSAINTIEDKKEKLLVVLDHQGERQQVREYGGCPFVRGSNEAGLSDPRILTEIQQVKERFKTFIGTLVTNSGHKQLLTDEELTEVIFLMTEGGVSAGSVFKHGADLQAAKKIIQKLI
jgi:AcrR family transcriptional regulator